MNALRTKLIAYKLDYHWYFIRKYRKQMVQLYERGADLSDERLLLLNEKFNDHYVRATERDRLFLCNHSQKHIKNAALPFMISVELHTFTHPEEKPQFYSHFMLRNSYSAHTASSYCTAARLTKILLNA